MTADLEAWINAEIDKHGRYDRPMVLAIALGAAARVGATPEPLTALYDAANAIHGALDEQTYDEQRHADWDLPLEHEFSVNITLAQHRALSAAICVVEKYRAALGAPEPLTAEPVRELILGMPQLSTRFDLDDAEAQWIDRVEVLRLLDARAALEGGVSRTEPALTDALRDVKAERARQVSVEGWTPEHDDHHTTGDLAKVAAFYAAAGLRLTGTVPDGWPWDEDWWKPKDNRSNLVKAGALILAEIERLDRALVATKEPT